MDLFKLIFLLYSSGTIGHVAHGKSTVVKAISGVQVILCIDFNVICVL